MEMFNRILLLELIMSGAELIPKTTVMLTKIIKGSQLMRDLPTDICLAHKPPIYVVGLPRTGTSWIASVLNTAQGIKYFYEPFNCTNVPGAAQYCMRYPYEDDSAFARYSRDAFAGRTNGRYVTTKLSWRYRRFRWWPGRVMVKDVCSCMALESIHQHISPITVIVMRHPCAVAASWFRLKYDIDMYIQRLLNQPKLLHDYLKPFEHFLKNASNYWQKMGAFWGATYTVMLQQQKIHPDWIVVQHEALCRDPVGQYRELFNKLNLHWTKMTDELLNISTTQDSHKPYLPHRVSSREPDKWKRELDPKQIEQVQQSVVPFGFPYYTDFLA